MPKPNEPIWFNVDKTETANDDTYQTIKTNKVENKIGVDSNKPKGRKA